MKLRHYTFLFALLLGAVMALISMRNSIEKKVRQQQLCYEQCIEYAADMAVKHMAVYEDGRLHIDCKGALEAFFRNLAAGLGVLDKVGNRDALFSLISCVLMADEEGYYLWHIVEEEGKRQYCLEEKRCFDQSGQQTKAAEIEAVLEGESSGKVEFYLPEADENFWIRGITQPGLYVLVKDWELTAGKETYESCFFSAAELRKD